MRGGDGMKGLKRILHHLLFFDIVPKDGMVVSTVLHVPYLHFTATIEVFYNVINAIE